jgi:tripartite-type tricarboxylate transporter receptor subunit TctC
MDRRSFVVGTVASAPRWRAVHTRKMPIRPAPSRYRPFPPGREHTITRRSTPRSWCSNNRSPENKAGAAGAVGTICHHRKARRLRSVAHRVDFRFRGVDKLFDRQPKFTNADFIPLARIVADPIVLIASKDAPYKTLKDLVADAKANPNKLIYSSSGLYGASHIPTVLFTKSAGNLEIRHLPTNGGGPAVTAVLGGNVNFFMSPTSIALPHIRAGKVQPLAVSSAKRTKSLPDVPTFKELGYDLEYYFWVGIFAPKGTPTPIINVLREGLNKAAHSKQFLDTLENLGQELAYMDQPEFAAFWAVDSKRQEDAINAIGRVQG